MAKQFDTRYQHDRSRKIAEMRAMNKAAAAVREKAQALQGKFVELDLSFLGGRTDLGLKGRVLGAGPEGITVDGENFCWPTSIKYHELLDIRPDLRAAS